MRGTAWSFAKSWRASSAGGCAPLVCEGGRKHPSSTTASLGSVQIFRRCDGFVQGPRQHASADRRVRAEFVLWSRQEFAKNRKGRALTLAARTRESYHCRAPMPTARMGNGRPRAVVGLCRYREGADMGTTDCAPVLGPQLLCGRKSYVRLRRSVWRLRTQSERWSPRSPSPFFTVVLAFERRSAASERPTLVCRLVN
jgi:hypothetical protein